jgi:imidazolonepropionase-like amidohydrolase
MTRTAKPPLVLCLALLLGVAAPAPASAQAFQVRAKEVLLGDGSRIENGVMLVENGRITRVGRGVEIDERFPVIEHDGVLTAGLVACQTLSGTKGEAHDETRSMLPEARMINAFRPGHPDYLAAAVAGITTVVLTPTAENLIGGTTAVVKTYGGSVLRREGHLAISFSKDALESDRPLGFLLFGAAEATEIPPAAGGPEETDATERGTRDPTSYPGALRALRVAFDGPRDTLARAARRELPVLLEAWDRHEVVRAAEFARAHSLVGALRGAPLAGDPVVLDAIKRSRLGVVLGPFAPEQTPASLESVLRLGEAGIPLAFALDGPRSHPERVRMSAVKALSAGAERPVVWKALTGDAATIAGVADRVGRLERGYDADFVLWSGDPLDLSSRIVAVYVDGQRVPEEPR